MGITVVGSSTPEMASSPSAFFSEGYLQLLAERLQQTSVENYYIVATCVWLVYDYFLTLRQEVDFIWREPFSGLSLLFYINRYGALALRVFVVAYVTPDTGPLSQEYADRLQCTVTFHRNIIGHPTSKYCSHSLTPHIRHLGLE
ncbi:hypothetical protein PsYK624_011430 [Phanerochaete sordida]|uniref:DUF6533 domain-containing protein n=1 Tax=Phanerochaete sordida TaxID=48140 RepID=A0A9P3FYU0_9APHY|nr:hypothetical protein PsYK624_011430 [Phanerochaete sordida]